MCTNNLRTYGLITSITFFRMICIAIDQFCLSIKQSELCHAKMHVLLQLRQHNVCRYTDMIVLIKEESYMTTSAAFWSKQQSGAIWDSSLEVRERRAKKTYQLLFAVVLLSSCSTQTRYSTHKTNDLCLSRWPNFQWFSIVVRIDFFVEVQKIQLKLVLKSRSLLFRDLSIEFGIL